jgi:hypothetical protein
MLYGYEVPGIILLSKLTGVTRLDHSKDMSVHVLTCTNYNFNACGAGKKCLYVLVQKMSDGFLEKGINMRFCVELGKNESDTCAVLSM